MTWGASLSNERLRWGELSRESNVPVWVVAPPGRAIRKDQGVRTTILLHMSDRQLLSQRDRSSGDIFSMAYLSIVRGIIFELIWRNARSLSMSRLPASRNIQPHAL